MEHLNGTAAGKYFLQWNVLTFEEKKWHIGEEKKN